ncbi:uncharacterized protein LOC135808196 [Sycon ciliatum]|uniref:uncharacterized protein LOC135808196 n=1 Tax=Sycon ciliatum TaxID=27933 RepID=UPI0020AE55AE|eukprot:scpid66231/ scgid10625/ SEC14-like protein 2; Alpha-tocopherol-associated protein; Squalene transfer protein; Supernatant protein factor
MSGRIGDLSDQQNQALKSIRRLISEGGPGTPTTQKTDVDLLRFLRARSFNVVAAFKQWKQTQEWREAYAVEDILKGSYPLEEELKSTLSLAYHGEDLDHRPLYLERSGAVDPLIVAQLNVEAVVRRHIYHQEFMVRRVEENAHQYDHAGLDNWCEIHDMRGLSLQHRQVLGMFTRLARIDTDFYPERAGRIFFVNVPAVFPALWKICRRALDAKTREKFVVLSANRMGELYDYFSPDQLPVEYGGTVQDLFPPLPPAFSSRRESRPLDGVKFLDTPVLARRRVMKAVECRAGDVVSWYFRVASKDVKFCAYWSNKTDAVNTANPAEVSRWLDGSSVVSESCVISASSDGFSDSYFSTEAGVLGMVWDNDSLFQSRLISFQLSVEKSTHYDVAAESRLTTGDDAVDGDAEVEINASCNTLTASEIDTGSKVTKIENGDVKITLLDT